ncbi:MAG: hypothetical protein KGP33_04590 [Betaproteobacteria bacterium]|jgi:hypothetical protein|nr:hypothetical protein [Betaproteobacteria bacterium]
MRLLAVLALMLMAGCVARTQEFHCKQDLNNAETFELKITPTSLTYRGRTFDFKEEAGALRRYRDTNQENEIEFNPIDGRLTLRGPSVTLGWSCTRYEGLK